MNEDTLLKFWDTVVDVWQHGFMGIDIGSIITALAIFGFFLIFRGLFSKYVLYRLRKYAGLSTNKLDDKIVDALIPPIKFVPIILGIFFATEYITIGKEVGSFFDNLVRSLIAFAIFWAIHRAAEPISHTSRGLERILSRTMADWVFKFLKVMIVFIGGAVILEMWGIEVGPLLAGLGLFGAAVALGAQDLFKNLIGGLTIIAEKRFFKGEWIKVDGVIEGTVEDIGFRSTKVRRFDKAPVHVPNASLSDAVVTNFSRMTYRRILWTIGVEYRTTGDQLKEIREGILAFIKNTDEFSNDEKLPTLVRIDSFGASSIDIIVCCFTNEITWPEWLAAKEKLAFAIKDIVEGAGTGFAFPSTSLYVESFPDDAAEIFNPPKKSAKK
ncbi:MAG: mechanosensitive ion channel family protein [Pseudomonadota bacterium]